jgi:hypothetical protein
MKAALEAWGADSNLFHQGAAKESDDPDVIAAAMKKPSVVLRRPVGSDGSFGEHAELPTNLGDGKKPTKAARKSKAPKAKKPASKPVDKAARKTAAAYDREQRRRDRERAREEATRKKERERRQQAMDKAQAAFDEAEREHTKRAAAIQAEMAAIEKKARAEDVNWDKQRGRLEAALRRARGLRQSRGARKEAQSSRVLTRSVRVSVSPAFIRGSAQLTALGRHVRPVY